MVDVSWATRLAMALVRETGCLSFETALLTATHSDLLKVLTEQQKDLLMTLLVTAIVLSLAMQMEIASAKM